MRAVLVTQAHAHPRALAPAAFYGTFSGGGGGENEDSLYFRVSARDLDVTIRPEGAGFSVAWTSVIRRAGEQQEGPQTRSKVTTKVFVPSDRPNVFRAQDAGDPLAGKELSWARIHGTTLTLYVMVVDAEGTYEVQRYDRTLSGSGMQRVFTREKDGEPVRKVTGRLVKTAN